MRDEMRNFKSWTEPKTLVISLLEYVRRLKNFQIINFLKKITLVFQKTKESPLLQNQSWQPVQMNFSFQVFYVNFKKIQKVSKKWSKTFQNPNHFSAKSS